MSSTDDLVNSIVREVLETLRNNTDVARLQVAGQVSAKSESMKSTGLSPTAQRTTSAKRELWRLKDKVLTEALLAERWSSQTRLEIARTTILTPSARDFLKKRRIEIIRADADGPTTQEVSANHPAARGAWRLYVVASHPRLDSLIEELRRIPFTIDRVIAGSVNESIEAAATALSRAEIDGGILLCTAPVAASCRANRQECLRAVPIRDVGEVRQARRELDVNFHCFDPTNKAYYELRRLLHSMMEKHLAENRYKS